MDRTDRPRVLVVDDEPPLRDLVELALVRDGFVVKTAPDGSAGLEAVKSFEPECIILDVMMPKIDGLSLIPMVRRLTEVPIILLTARGDVRDRIEGLQAGADDYLAKPFDVDELAERVRAALRRPNLRHVDHVRVADLEIDVLARSVRRGERTIPLSTREFDLLLTLARRPKRVFTRDELLDLVWGAERDVSPATVETYISYVRQKVDAGERDRLIYTIRGVGYALRP